MERRMTERDQEEEESALLILLRRCRFVVWSGVGIWTDGRRKCDVM